MLHLNGYFRKFKAWGEELNWSDSSSPELRHQIGFQLSRHIEEEPES